MCGPVGDIEQKNKDRGGGGEYVRMCGPVGDIEQKNKDRGGEGSMYVCADQ